MYEQKLKEILKDIKPTIIEYTGNQFVSDGILESVEIMEIVLGIEEAFNIVIEPQYIVPEYFESIKTLEQLIEDVEKG
ncbi:MAG: hypothetical protein NC337_04010 [Roseburia sp.]|nr:hypothetical protein [Roseburia sp.]